MTGTNKIIAESNAANKALSITMKIIRGANAMYSTYHRHMGKKDTAAYGIEVVQEASACADELMELNGLSGQMFNVCGTVEGELAGVFARTRGMSRVIVCDPPRKGMERSVTEAIKGCGADKVILVSCNPATLARDLGLLLGSLKDEGGVLKKTPDYASTSAYRISYIQPYDMFPQTKHVETLICLERK